MRSRKSTSLSLSASRPSRMKMPCRHFLKTELHTTRGAQSISQGDARTDAAARTHGRGHEHSTPQRASCGQTARPQRKRVARERGHACERLAASRACNKVERSRCGRGSRGAHASATAVTRAVCFCRHLRNGDV
eukprot:6197817-Pleurochrysis_carterae.AAC.2